MNYSFWGRGPQAAGARLAAPLLPSRGLLLMWPSFETVTDGVPSGIAIDPQSIVLWYTYYNRYEIDMI